MLNSETTEEGNKRILEGFHHKGQKEDVAVDDVCTYRRRGLNEDVETLLIIISPLRCDLYHLSLHEREFSEQKLILGKHADKLSQLSRNYQRQGHSVFYMVFHCCRDNQYVLHHLPDGRKTNVEVEQTE